MVITKTPLRISFVGGGTDIQDYYRLSGGAVVSVGIDKYIYIIVNRKFNNRVRLSYACTEEVDNIRELRHELTRECLKLVGIEDGIEIISVTDIPYGTGLGSSSAFTVGLLNALYTYVGKSLPPEKLAELACRVEIDILKHPIGKQDQYAAAYGGMNYFLFNPDGSVSRHGIELDDKGKELMREKLMLLFTGITRNANSILKEQKQNISSKLQTLDFMVNQAKEMYTELTENGFNENFGKALHQGWIRKRSLASAISSGPIDGYYTKALENGAVGGKLLGAGGGGFLLFYCDGDKQSKVEKALGLTRVDFEADFAGSQVIYVA